MGSMETEPEPEPEQEPEQEQEPAPAREFGPVAEVSSPSCRRGIRGIGENIKNIKVPNLPFENLVIYTFAKTLIFRLYYYY